MTIFEDDRKKMLPESHLIDFSPFFLNNKFMIYPPPEITENANIKNYEKLYRQSIEEPGAFWENIAQELRWFKPWDKVL